MHEPSFLARKTWRLSHYLLIALGLAFFVALIPRGVRMAIESNTNNAKDWLPPTFAESTDLKWFQRHFVGEQFAVVSYEGCTYGKYEVDGKLIGGHEKLSLLASKLMPAKDSASGGANGPTRPGDDAHESGAGPSPNGWFKRVITGPSIVDELMAEAKLSESEALKRLEGALVGPRGVDADGNLLPQESRPTCLVVTLSPRAVENNLNMRKAIESIAEVAQEECAIPAGIEHRGFFGRFGAWSRRTILGAPPAPDILRLGGPPVDNISIDIEGERTLYRLAGLSGIVGLSLSFLCFRSVKLTAFVFAVGVISAGMSLAIVYYYAVLIEQLLQGLAEPRLGTVDAILMSMPAVVYVLGLSGAIHIVNYYKDARRETGLAGAAESALSHAWKPCTLAALTTAVGLASLYISDIMPIKKFGLFTALGVLGTLAVLFTLLPVALHRFPLSEQELRDDKLRNNRQRRFSIDGIIGRVGGFVVRHNVAVCVFWFAVMALFAMGLPRIKTSVQLLKLFDEDAEILHDYAWLEKHLGNLVPMEVVLAIDPEQTRTGEPGDLAEANGQRYRMTMLERVEMIEQIKTRMEARPQIGRVLSVATFMPDDLSGLYEGAYAANRQLEKQRDRLLADDYLREEVDENGKPTGRELWRLSARVRALDDGRGQEMDYGQFVGELRETVDPIILAYRQRDEVLRELDRQGKRLSTSRLVVLYRAAVDQPGLAEGSQEKLLVDLLAKSGPETIARGKKKHVRRIQSINLAKLSATGELQAKQREALASQFDAAIIVSAGSQDALAKQLAEGMLLIDVSAVPISDVSPPVTWAVEKGKPHPVAAIYTGIVPLVYKTQRELLNSLATSIALATVLISLVMVGVLRSAVAGVVSMIPNIFPIILVFGSLGWLGIKVDIGIMMTASVALGVAVDDTIHFVWWFRHGIREGMNRRDAAMYAYDRCGTAMIQTTLIAGLGLAVFATSTFTPTQQFGFLMITILSTALMGDLLLLPAILSGPAGRFFGAPALAAADDADDDEQPGGSPSTLPAPRLVQDSRRRDAAHRSARAS